MLKVVDGEVLEKSAVEYFQGSGTMLAGLEKILEGLAQGAERKGVLKAKDAFGAADFLPSKKLARKDFPADAALDVGSQFAAKGPDGADVMFRVLAVSEEDVEVKLVHPLADKDIEYELKVLSVSDPAPPPLPSDAVSDDD